MEEFRAKMDDIEFTNTKFVLKFKSLDSPLAKKFLNAQAKGDGHGCSIYDGLMELKKTYLKTLHWSWYGFPQLRGPRTKSPIAIKYAIADLEEAERYLSHPSLRNNLMVTLMVVFISMKSSGSSNVLQYDQFKFKSCVTLFHQKMKKCCLDLCKN